jgi:hypothetical protein
MEVFSPARRNRPGALPGRLSSSLDCKLSFSHESFFFGTALACPALDKVTSAFADRNTEGEERQ